MITFSIWKESVVLFFEGLERTADLPMITQPFGGGAGAQLQASWFASRHLTLERLRGAG